MDRYLTHDVDDGGESPVGLQFNQGFFCRTATAVNEDTSEIMSYMIPHYNVVVQAFLVDDFEGDDTLGVEIIPDVKNGISLVRIDRNMWDFIEDVAGCEHEEMMYKGMVLGELLVGTAHRMIVEATGGLPPFI